MRRMFKSKIHRATVTHAMADRAGLLGHAARRPE